MISSSLMRMIPTSRCNARGHQKSYKVLILEKIAVPNVHSAIPPVRRLKNENEALGRSIYSDNGWLAENIEKWERLGCEGRCSKPD